MPRNKDLKRLVRARMSKTGESYTTSRTRILAQPASPRTRPRGSVAPTPPSRRRAEAHPEYAELAGMSDAAIKANTGCTWDGWVVALDYHGAAEMSHRDIAELVSTKWKVRPWWTQAVTVGYERIKGLRARGQRRDGTYEANKSRTFNVPVSTLFDAWANARLRARWLDGTIGKVRTRSANKSMRLDGEENSIVAVGFMSKGPAKSAVAVQHTKLRDRDTADRLKQYWAERLDALGEILR